MSQYNSRTADKFVVRLPDGMRDQINDVARENHRSMNSEIIARLKVSLATDAPPLEVASGEGQLPEVVSDSDTWVPAKGVLVRVNGVLGVIEGFTFHRGDYHVEVMTEKGPQVALPNEVKPVRHRV